MPREGREFEEAYEWLYSLDERYKVTSPAYLYDKAAGINREIDVLVEYTDEEGIPRKISIECRDRKSTQNVMWIEQLQQKREDIGVDCIIATTTSKFSEAAINKAKYHGVIIERAEMFSSQTIEKASRKFFFDAFFLKFELLELDFYTKSIEKISLRQYLKTLNVFEQHTLIKLINTDLYYSINPNQIIDDCKVSANDFYSKEDSRMELNYTTKLDKKSTPVLLKNFIQAKWKVRITPYKVTLPLIDSISVFDGESKSNKDYRAIYGNDEEYFRIGYLDNNLFTELNLKPRKYMRFASAHIGLNTIIPNDIDKTFKNCTDNLIQIMTSGFDMTYLSE